MIASDYTFARIGYEAYCRERSKSDTITFPTWDELSDDVQRAWVAAATATMDALTAAVLT